MTMMKSDDGSQYVLVLNKEEAELLGTLRFHHVAGNTPLYAVLRGLPPKNGARFRTEVASGNTPVFHELIPERVAGGRRGELLTRPTSAPATASGG